MKKIIKAAFLVLFMFFGMQSFSQQNNTLQSDNTLVSTTFSVEINAGTTLEDLKKIEEMLLNDYKVKVLFENVRIEDDKIVALRMQLINGNQSLLKSIDNYNVPIKAFKINLTESNPGAYKATITSSKDLNNTHFNSADNLSGLSEFYKEIPDLKSEFIDLESQFDSFFEEFEISRKKMQQLFEKFQDGTSNKKELSTSKSKTENSIKNS